MDQKEILAIGMIVAFILTAFIAIKPVKAQDNEYVTQTGGPVNVDIDVPVNIDTAINTAIIANSGDDNTAVAESSQNADVTPSNDISDDETNSIDVPSVLTP
jgi:hypothetical protein